ncbi:MAG: DUF1553 domain-containing protein [Bryobacterales bacterium]|nr:DUF1553 domain-containing protein [Bryobacterales bacterium]
MPLSLAAFAQQPAAAPRALDFNRDILPILSDKCFACHGPDEANNKSKLRLDNEASAKADLGNGRRAIVPGQPAQSQLIRRITASQPGLLMPPVHSGRKLSPADIERLQTWVAQGATWDRHWSFVAPKRPKLPGTAAGSPIDAFVLARLRQEGLTPSAEADRATLLRRVTLDLTGLPPTPAELDTFLADRSPNSYERAVDRLLASSRYGERMAFRWLDAARYADTNGYQVDGEREMWRWRDWVIEAFNRNLPFDRFVIEQLAGDLLPNPTLDQRIATAFNRNHRGNSEDGLVPEEYAVEYVIDRVDTVSTVFLGLTMGCARCHNHKYDPITQKEYYQLYAFFNSIPEDGRFNNFGNAAPWIFAPTQEQQREMARLHTEIRKTSEQLAARLQQAGTAQKRWESTITGTARHWFPKQDLELHQPLDETAPGFQGGTPKFVSSPLGQATAFDGSISFDAGKVANFDYRDRVHDFRHRFAISAWIQPESENAGAIVTRMGDGIAEKKDGLPSGRGYGLFFVNGKLHFNLISVWADDSFRVETADKQKVGEWQHVVATFDSLEPYDKVRIYVNGQQQKLKVNNGRLFRQFAANGTLRIGAGGGPEWSFKGAIDEVRIFKSLPDAEQISILACPDSLQQIAAIPEAQRTNAQRLKLRNAYLEDAASPDLQSLWRQLLDLQHQRKALETSLPTLMVMQELPAPRQAHILKRGAYDAPGDPVQREVPAMLPAFDSQLPRNRLGLAQWLVSADNPLLARVTVNRFWQMFFGTGLVKTAEDFGAQGERPSHPDLLDWLAVEFQQNGWNVKSLLKTIVMSGTYRQSSIIAPDLLQRDPDNRLLARGPRLRLPAEMIRDQALFVSGLLAEKSGGPSVRPYQPDGLYKDMLFSNMTGYAQEKGEGLWRRSLYTFWKRTVMPPSMQVMDASAREACTVRETRTNTPLQALNLMNDTTYVEAARVLAERMLREGGTTPQQQVTHGWRIATGRAPKDAEREILLRNLQSQQAYFRQRPREAAEFLGVGAKSAHPGLEKESLAAYTMVASLILNLDEVITKQ